MRTVVENRRGLGGAVGFTQNLEYVHLDQKLPQSKSCFYDFGEQRQVKFVASSDDKKSDFIEDLMKRFC